MAPGPLGYTHDCNCFCGARQNRIAVLIGKNRFYPYERTTHCLNEAPSSTDLRSSQTLLFRIEPRRRTQNSWQGKNKKNCIPIFCLFNASLACCPEQNGSLRQKVKHVSQRRVRRKTVTPWRKKNKNPSHWPYSNLSEENINWNEI